VLPQSYQDLMEAAAGAGRPLRAAEFARCSRAGHGQGGGGGTAADAERLAVRGWLAGEPGGLFTLPDHTGNSKTRTVTVLLLPGRAGRRAPSARGSFYAAHVAHVAVTRRCGPVIGKRQLKQSAVNAAAGIPAFCAARIPEPCTSSTLPTMSAGCKGIVMRLGALREATAKAAARLGKMRTRLAPGEKPNRTRMAALVTVYDAEPASRRPHDVIAPSGGRHGTRSLRPGPEAQANGWPGQSGATPPR
jgi:hypothetical protein